MLILTFQTGSESYGIECRHIVEVAPAVSLRPVPHAPAVVAGVCEYRGEVITVLDLSTLMVGRPCARRLDTRLIVLNAGNARTGPKTVGILAERVTDLRTIDVCFVGRRGPRPFDGMGPVVKVGDHLLQLLDPELLLERAAATAAPISSPALLTAETPAGGAG